MWKKERYMMSNLIRLVEIKSISNNERVTLDQIIINKNLVVAAKANQVLKNNLINTNIWPEELDQRLDITEIHMSTNASSEVSKINVLGNLETVTKKMEFEIE